MAYSRRAAIAAGTGAAKSLRSKLRAQGYADCSRCQFRYLASALDVDHKVALVNGGTDTEDNVWALCRRCHVIKTAEDLGYTTTPF